MYDIIFNFSLFLLHYCRCSGSPDPAPLSIQSNTCQMPLMLPVGGCRHVHMSAIGEQEPASESASNHSSGRVSLSPRHVNVLSPGPETPRGPQRPSTTTLAI